MNSYKLQGRPVNGVVTVPPSKSYAHRALIASALCGRQITVKNIAFSDDIKATIESLRQLGTDIVAYGNYVTLNGKDLITNSEVSINANESGSTLRFMIPIAVMLGNNAVFDGSGRLPERPLDSYFDIFEKNNIKYTVPKGMYLPLKTIGTFTGCEFEVEGNVSSQFITGLMLCGMIKPVKITVTTELESKPYVDITADVLRSFGCKVTFSDNVITIQKHKTEITEYTVENDWSQGAFFLCAGAINGAVTLGNMNINSAQGDRKIIDILKEFGADISIDGDDVSVKKSTLYSVDIDAKDIPDLVPVLCVLASYSKGDTKIYNAKRLRLKESDRLLAMHEELSKLGVSTELGDDHILIKGCSELTGNTVESHNDHRIVMSMAVASVGCNGEVTINGHTAVNKSYPDFFDDWSCLYE